MEREALLDPRDHRLVDLTVFAELALALRALAGGKVAKAWFTAHDLASSGDLDALGRGLFRLATCNGSRHGAGTVAGELALAMTFCRAAERVAVSSGSATGAPPRRDARRRDRRAPGGIPALPPGAAH